MERDVSEQIEEILRIGLRHGADGVFADTAFQDRAIAHGVTARRTRRRAVWLSSAAAGVAAVLAISFGISAVAHRQDPASTHDNPKVSDTSGDQSPFSWARGLPEGSPPMLAYVLDGLLHQGDTTVPVPGTQSEVIGEAQGGWVVASEYDDKQGTPIRTAYGVLTASGEFTKLPSDPYNGSVQVQAMSPGGNIFATGGALIDLRTLQVVGRTPENAQFASDWTRAGLMYLDSHQKMWLWNQGKAAVPVNGSFIAVAKNAAIGVTAPQSGCSRVTRIRDDGTLQGLYTGCDDNAPLSVSPGGRFVVTQGLGVIDVAASGASLGPLDIPAEVAGRWHGLVWWENDNAVLLSIVGSSRWSHQFGKANGTRPAVIVRCRLSSMLCQRAGPELSLDPSTWLDLR
jgi:hypothetical protein